MNKKEQLVRYLGLYQAKDLEGLAAMVATEAELRDWNLSVKGKDAFLKETAKNFSEARSIKIDVLTLWENAESAAAELLITVDDTIRLAVVDVLTFNTEGLVISSRSYKGREAEQ